MFASKTVMIALSAGVLGLGTPTTLWAQSLSDFDGDTVPNGIDNCPFAANLDQSDLGGVGQMSADGLGDACQCGDMDDDGWVGLLDVVILRRYLATRPPEIDDPSKCSVEGGSSDCDEHDVRALREELAGLSPALTQVCLAAVGATDLPANTAACGDSITQAFAADCTCNMDFFCLLCLLGDQSQHSWFDGSDADVFSVYDRYLRFDGSIGSDKSAATSGARMVSGDDSFSIQAGRILAQVPLPDLVFVLLGGNDLCSRECVDPTHCSKPLYSEGNWREAVRAGLDKLVIGLPQGATVYLLGVPRVHDVRQAGLDKQSSTSSIDCEAVWASFDICSIVTQGTALNGETLDTRLATIAERQLRYNEVLREEAEAYTSNSNGRNPRGIEVVAEYTDEISPSVGTFSFRAEDVNGGDCFHPSLAGQNTIGQLAWMGNPVR
jgi:hypothetical protein